MVEISESKARSLIVSGQAGYWGLHARVVVIEHEAQCVVRLQQKLYLASSSEIKVKFCGEAGVLAGRMKGAFAIEINSEEIEALARQELVERGDAILL
jgi:hypothetical protein